MPQAADSHQSGLKAWPLRSIFFYFALCSAMFGLWRLAWQYADSPAVDKQLRKRLTIGMPQDEVRALLGAPDRVSPRHAIEGVTRVSWVYERPLRSRSLEVRFSRDRVVDRIKDVTRVLPAER
ncbi:MAG: hypothetical protein AAGB00_08240 [Planctomycetota bacterium]